MTPLKVNRTLPLCLRRNLLLHGLNRPAVSTLSSLAAAARSPTVTTPERQPLGRLRARLSLSRQLHLQTLPAHQDLCPLGLQGAHAVHTW